MGIKEKYAYRKLQKMTAAISRVPKIPDLENIRKVGVVWQPTQKDAFRYLKHYFNRKQVIFRGFCVFEESVEPQLAANSITTKELNWWGFPKPGKTNDFTSFDFDLLINVALKQNFILDYLTALSVAKFKVGWSPSENNFFDLNINIGQNQDALYLAKQQIFYLGQLNKKTTE
ncbi:MAG: hypothetical protein J7L95_03735 [Prolixibacteraceae bacterium]|nr:hypothetical protein [Prolixibacteraceae bacterium]